MFVFGSGSLVCTPFGANAAANPTPMQLATLQECTIDISANQKELYGKAQFPVAIARTTGKVTIKAKFADVKAKVLNDLFWGAAVSAGTKIGVIDEAHTPASGSVAITPPTSGTFADDFGVRDAVTGAQLTLASSAPPVGSYSVNAGTYTFNASDTTGKLISYSYTMTTAGTKSNVTNKPMGAMPVFQAAFANSQYQTGNFVHGLWVFPQCIASKLSIGGKNEDFTIPDFECSAFADSANNIMYQYLDE